MATRTLTTAAKNAAATGVVKTFVLLLELDFEGGLLHVCSLNYSFEYNGYTWLGVGSLGAVERVVETESLEAPTMRYTISNVNGGGFYDALNTTYKNRPARMWFAFLDTDGQVIADPVLLHYGLMDQMVVHDGGDVCTVAVTVRNRLSDWSKPRMRRFTDEDQQAEFPNDKGCQFVVDGASKEIVWGRA
jgi:hypothetical protein